MKIKTGLNHDNNGYYEGDPHKHLAVFEYIVVLSKDA